MLPLRISGTTLRLACTRQLMRFVAQLGPTIGIVIPGGRMSTWKRPLLPGGKLSRPGRLLKALGHHTLCQTRRSMRILTPSLQVYHLANQFRKENAYVVGDKPVKNYEGKMSMGKDRRPG